MWYVIVFVLGYLAAIYSWPAIKGWLKALYEHPEETVQADITALEEKYRRPAIKGWLKALYEHPEETVRADIAALEEQYRKIRSGS